MRAGSSGGQPFEVPATFLAYGAPGTPMAAFLDRLPALVRDVVEDWRLTLDGPARHGRAALVVPVRTPAGRPAVLKLSSPHEEAEHEHLGLRAWDGRGAVRLLRADPHRWALLLERLHGDEDLTSVGDLEACEVVAGFYARLHVPALPQLRRLSSYVDRWTDRLAALPPDAPLPRRLVEQAVSLGRTLVTDRATDARMIHGDLHGANVLAADREPWLVIDPKPYVGDPCYDVLQHALNCPERLVADPVGLAERLAALVHLDADRVRLWLFARCTIESLERPDLAAAARSLAP